MVGVSASVNLPLHHKAQKFSSGSLGTGSPGWSRKKGCKTVVVWWYENVFHRDFCATYCFDGVLVQSSVYLFILVMH